MRLLLSYRSMTPQPPKIHLTNAADYREVPQHYGVNLAKTVIVAGSVVAGSAH